MKEQNSLDSLFHYNPLPNLVYDTTTYEILEVNQAAIDFYGYTRSELVSMNLKDLRPKEEIPKLYEAHSKVLKENQNINFGIFVHKKKLGAIVLVEVNGYKVQFKERDCILVTYLDVTEKKKEEHQLKLLESVIKNANDSVIITEAIPIDESGPRILYVNEAFTRMTGYTADEVIGQPPKFLHGPDSEKEELDKLTHAMQEWKSCEITVLNYKKNGDEFWNEISVSPVSDQNGQFTHWIAIVRDVTLAKNKQIIKDLLAKITAVFNQTPNLSSSLEELCKVIVNFGRFDFCEIWSPNIKSSALRLNASFSRAAVGELFCNKVKSFEEMNFDQGLPGTVWTNKTTLIWSETELKTLFLRNEAAAEAGIRSVMGIPLMHLNRIVGVLVIGTQEGKQKTKRHESVLNALEEFIGSEVNRKQLENDYVDLFKALPDLIALMDFNGNFLKINQVGCDVLEYTEAELIGQPLERFIHPSDKAVLSNEIQKLNPNQTLFQFENRFLSKSGKTLWLSWHCNVMMEEQVLYTAAKDITETKKTNQLYEEASQMAKIGSWELNFTEHNQSDTMYWSPMVRQILEVSPNYEATLSGGYEFFDAASKTTITKATEKLIQEGTEFDEELLLITPKGKEKWIRCIGKSEHVNGTCTKIFGSFQDINKMKATSLQLTEILGSISDAFYAVDYNWNFTYFNTEAENLLLKKRDEVVGKNFWKVFPLAVGTSLEDVYRRVAKLGIAENFEYWYPADEKWYEIHVYPSNGGISSYFKNIDERKRAAEALEKEYQDKIKILESIGDAFITMLDDFTVTYWNQTAERILGIKREEILGKNLWDLFPDAVNLPSYANYHQVLATREPMTFEDYYGVWLEVNVHASNEGISVFFRDITLKKEADQRLLLAFEEKNRILESIGDAFFAVDTNWTVTYWNREAEKVLGLSREQIIGKNLWEIYYDAVDSDFYIYYHKAMETGGNVNFEEYYPTLNKWFEVSAYPSTEGLSIYFKDITLRKQTDIKIQQANERFEKVTQATTDAIWDWDIETDVLYRGNGFEKLFGLEVSKNLKSNEFWRDNFYDEDVPQMLKSLQLSLEDPTCEFWEMEYRICHTSGEIKTVFDKGMIIRNESGKAIRMVGAINDISNLKKHEQELKYLNKMLKTHIQELELTNEQLEQFAYVASHDLQEPLRMISSFLTLLQLKYHNQLDDKANQYINFANEGAKKMKQILMDLLEYSKIGSISRESESIDMFDFFQEYKFLRREKMLENKVTINYIGPVKISSYRTPLVQIVYNLLDNAIKYAKPDVPPQINVSIEERAGRYLFEVSDNGIGIASEYFSKIFVIFQRLEQEQNHEGTGIGLAVVKKVIESLGGKIGVTSEVGKGTTFYFSIIIP